jgi:hypothetical protein
VGRAPGNATNPRTGSGVQQTRNTDTEQTVEGVRNPEDGTGFDGSHHRTERGASLQEWTGRLATAEGRKAGESQERRNSDFFGSREEFCRDESALKERRRSRRRSSTDTERLRKRHPPNRRRRRTWKNLEDPAGNGQGRGGCGKGERPATMSTAEVHAVPHRYDVLEASKIPPTPRELTDLLRQDGIPTPPKPL